MSRTAPPPAGRRRRVLILSDTYWHPYGGTEGQILHLVRNLPPGWEAEVAIFHPSAWIGKRPYPCPSRSLGIPRPFLPTSWPTLLRLARELRSRRFDLLHAFMIDAGTVAPLLGRLAGVPAIVSRRDLGYWRTPRRTAVLRRTGRRAAAFLANAQAVRRDAIAAEHVLPSDVHVVRNGHPRDAFDAPADAGLRARLGIPADARLVGLLANPRPLKRPTDLLDAVAQLGKAYRDVHVLFLGDGDFGAVRAEAERLGLAARVHVAALEGADAAVLKNLALGVLCSESEGLSNAILEYMGCGLPVVATRVGGNPELVVDGVTGLLYEAGDTTALRQALRRVLDDAAAAARMGADGRLRFEREFSVERMVADTVALYERVLAPPPLPPSDLAVEVLSTRDAVEALAPDWGRLVGPWGFFAGPPWVRAWLDAAAGGARPEVLAVRDPSGALVGVLPLARRGDALAFCGAGLGADHLDVVAAPGREADVARAVVAEWRASRWRRIDLAHLAEDGALRAALHHHPAAPPLVERLGTVSPFLALGGTWDGWLASLSKKRRQVVRAAVARLLETPGIEVRSVAEADEVPGALDALFDLHDRRSAAVGRASSFTGPVVRDLHRRLAAQLLAAGRLYLLVVRREGVPVGAHYGFREGGVHHQFQTGFDPAESRLSPGMAMHALAIRDALERGCTAYDFMDGDEAYKASYATDERRLFDARLFRPTPGGRLASRAYGAARLVRDLLRPPA